MQIKHSRVHYKNNGPFPCNLCGDEFKYKASYDWHVIRAHKPHEVCISFLLYIGMYGFLKIEIILFTINY